MPVQPDAPITITAYDWVPPQARGFVKDLRVRWALEEIGLPYAERLFSGAGGEKTADHLAVQPFGQVPTYHEGELILFESGAILLHLGAKDDRLLPRQPAARARAIGWMFAALNSVEPFTAGLFLAGWVSQGQEWHVPVKAGFRPLVEQRLAGLARKLGDREWLEGPFTLGDLLMVDVLRAVTEPALIAAHPILTAYLERGTSRPAFQAAMAAQLAVFDRFEADQGEGL